MDVKGKVVAVTGGANGIGRALAERFHAEGARGVAVADLDGAAAEAVARAVGGLGMAVDVADEADIVRFVEAAERDLGPIDLFCSNAGVATADPDPCDVASAPNDAWLRDYRINVLAHVYAARALVPRMRGRGGGWFLHTISAAGLLSRLGSAVYSTTKHAAVGFAESLAITHRDDGIRVSILCPQAVDTKLYRDVQAQNAAGSVSEVDGVMSPEAVAEAVIEGLAVERFLILPHASVATYMRNKAADYDRWLGGMAKLRRASLKAP